MPRSVAVFFGFVSVAFSIGFNTMRYPVVWDMVGPAMTSELGALEAVRQEKADVAAMTSGCWGDSSTATPTDQVASPCAKGDIAILADMKMGTVASEKRPIENPQQARESLSSGNDRPAVESANSDKPERLAPLVPVMQTSSPNASAGDVAGSVGIRRLPPVDQIVPNPDSRDAARFSNGSIPVYPSTKY
jgi:hypothetical protein